MEFLRQALLAIHIAAGFTAVIASCAAALSKVLRMTHRAHLIAGRTFAVAMLGIFLTSLPLSILGGSLLLLLVAILSGYLAFAGWREAVRSRAGGRGLDRAAAILMLLAGLVMCGWGAMALLKGNAGGIVLVAFGSIGLSLAASDLRRIGRPSDRPTRVANHMIRMMGATIAVLTASLVVNVRLEPGWLVWIAPTLVLTPFIAVWARRIRSGRMG
jgi:hypothetical protein